VRRREFITLNRRRGCIAARGAGSATGDDRKLKFISSAGRGDLSHVPTETYSALPRAWAAGSNVAGW
jgi:hypothetical protein